MPEKQIYIVTGQTATGKTSQAIKLAQKHNGVLINADSRQVYKLITITTGKDLPNKAEFKTEYKLDDYEIGYYLIDNIPIYLYDLVYPNQYISSYDWAKIALDLIKKLFNEYQTIVIVGGSYFYIYNLLYKLESYNAQPNFNLRDKLKNKSVIELRSILDKLNPKILDQLNNSDRNNPYRLIRKIEILSHQPKASLNKSLETSKMFLAEKLGLKKLKVKFLGYRFKDNLSLEDTIKKRVEQRLKQGAIAEIETILKLGYTKTDQGLKTLGVSQIIEFLDKKINYEQLKELWIKKEVKYAKKQFMLMKRDTNINWKAVD
ncbi:MAG: tRNA dimethylallyltransferase [Patescibacteria group bacterium]|nr:MAG: tRNA dimethylallyltransferase [Patescibacteria group bacterium]